MEARVYGHLTHSEWTGNGVVCGNTVAAPAAAAAPTFASSCCCSYLLDQVSHGMLFLRVNGANVRRNLLISE